MVTSDGAIAFLGEGEGREMGIAAMVTRRFAVDL